MDLTIMLVIIFGITVTLLERFRQRLPSWKAFPLAVLVGALLAGVTVFAMAGRA